MFAALAGLQKYFIVAAALAFAALATAAVSYRAAYNSEYQKRADIEASLQRTVEAYETLARSNAVALDAVNRAIAASQAINEQRRTQRERVLTAPNDQDGPVAPVLRDAISGVRQ
jgi:signal transduction histidine kinase